LKQIKLEGMIYLGLRGCRRFKAASLVLAASFLRKRVQWVKDPLQAKVFGKRP
jgi:hypothetical protein